MEPGCKYYFEIKVVKGSYCKIGVARKDSLIESAFSDNESGWALFNGQVRHGSDCDGQKLKNAQVKSGDIIGVMVDMQEGVLSFTKNGEFLGVGFNDKKLIEEDLFPAVALL